MREMRVYQESFFSKWKTMKKDTQWVVTSDNDLSYVYQALAQLKLNVQIFRVQVQEESETLPSHRQKTIETLISPEEASTYLNSHCFLSVDLDECSFTGQELHDFIRTL